MSKKLSRYLEDIEKTEKKMAELKAHLEAVRQSQKADEDAEIVHPQHECERLGFAPPAGQHPERHGGAAAGGTCGQFRCAE